MTHELQHINTRTDISLSEIVQIVWRRKMVFLLLLAAALSLAALASHRMSKRWHATAGMVLVQRATTTDAAKPSYAPPVIESVETQMALLQSDALPQRTLDWLRSRPGQTGAEWRGSEWTPVKVQRSLTVINPKETNVFQVSAEASSPDRAAQMANGACEAFLIWKKELARQQVREIAQSLQVRAAGAEAQLRSAEAQEKLFKQQHHLSDVAGQEKFLLDRYQAEQMEVSGLQKEAASLSARHAALGANIRAKNSQLLTGGGVRDDASAVNLQAQLTQMEMDRADAAQKFTPEYPGVLPQMDAKIRDVKKRLAQVIHGTLSGHLTTLQSQGALLSDYQETEVNAAYNAAKLATANRQLASMVAPISGLPGIDSEYKQIVRTVDLANTLYTSLQSSLDAARLDEEIATDSVQITHKAIVPLAPFRPNTSQNLALGAMVGLFLGSLLVLWLEQTDRRVHTAADVQRLLPAPILGSLPLLPQGQSKTLLVGKADAKVLESYRYAYANLLLTLHQSQQVGLLDQSVILVTSAVSGEGKTVTARQLARAMARCGKRTILVDADLRLRVPNSDAVSASDKLGTFGLADVLRGKTSLEEAITDSEDRNLLLLGRGRVDEECTDLISLPQMENILKTLRNMADVVIVDAPACLDRPDVFFLAPMADCIVQVVGAGRVQEPALRQAFDSLSAARPSLHALFLNFSAETRVPLVATAGEKSLPVPAPLQSLPAWDLGEKLLLSENKTTKIIVQNLPGGRRAVSLVPPSQPE